MIVVDERLGTVLPAPGSVVVLERGDPIAVVEDLMAVLMALAKTRDAPRELVYVAKACAVVIEKHREKVA